MAVAPTAGGIGPLASNRSTFGVNVKAPRTGSIGPLAQAGQYNAIGTRPATNPASFQSPLQAAYKPAPVSVAVNPAAPITNPNEGAIQRVLRASVGGSALPATQYDQPFQNAVSNAYNAYQSGTSNLDLSQSREGADYITNRANDIRQQGYDQDALNNLMADRGLTFSGARLNRNAMLDQKYVDMLNALALSHQRRQEDVTRQRQALAGQYASSVNAAENNYVAGLNKYLQDQAKAQAQAAQTNAQAIADRAVAQGKQATATATTQSIQDQINALAGQGGVPAGLPTGPPGTDWNAVARAYKLGPYAGLPTGPAGTDWAAVARAYGIGQ